MTGIFYFPENHLELRGDGDTIGSQIIADTIAIGGTGLIHIAAPHIAGKPILNISSTEFDFNADEDRENPSSQILLINNIGAETLNWWVFEDFHGWKLVPSADNQQGNLMKLF